MPGQSSRVTGRDSCSSAVEAGVPAWLSRFSTWIDLGTATLNGLGILVTLGLMLAINIDVAGRTLFGSPINGIPELATLCVVSIVFLQISQACRSGRLTRSNVVLDWLRTRCVNCVACLEVLFDLVAAGMVSIILIVSVPLFLKSMATEAFIGSIGVFTVPLWPVKGIILIGCAMLTLQLLLSSLRQIFRLWHQRHQRLQRHRRHHGAEHDND